MVIDDLKKYQTKRGEEGREEEGREEEGREEEGGIGEEKEGWDDNIGFGKNSKNNPFNNVDPTIVINKNEHHIGFYSNDELKNSITETITMCNAINVLFNETIGKIINREYDEHDDAIYIENHELYILISEQLNKLNTFKLHIIKFIESIESNESNESNKINKNDPLVKQQITEYMSYMANIDNSIHQMTQLYNKFNEIFNEISPYTRFTLIVNTVLRKFPEKNEPRPKLEPNDMELFKEFLTLYDQSLHYLSTTLKNLNKLIRTVKITDDIKKGFKKMIESQLEILKRPRIKRLFNDVNMYVTSLDSLADDSYQSVMIGDELLGYDIKSISETSKINFDDEFISVDSGITEDLADEAFADLADEEISDITEDVLPIHTIKNITVVPKQVHTIFNSANNSANNSSITSIQNSMTFVSVPISSNIGVAQTFENPVLFKQELNMSEQSKDESTDSTIVRESSSVKIRVINDLTNQVDPFPNYLLLEHESLGQLTLFEEPIVDIYSSDLMLRYLANSDTQFLNEQLVKSSTPSQLAIEDASTTNQEVVAILKMDAYNSFIPDIANIHRIIVIDAAYYRCKAIYVIESKTSEEVYKKMKDGGLGPMQYFVYHLIIIQYDDNIIFIQYAQFEDAMKIDIDIPLLQNEKREKKEKKESLIIEKPEIGLVIKQLNQEFLNTYEKSEFEKINRDKPDAIIKLLSIYKNHFKGGEQKGGGGEQKGGEQKGGGGEQKGRLSSKYSEYETNPNLYLEPNNQEYNPYLNQNLNPRFQNKYNQGFNPGFNPGFNQGFNQGFNPGFNQGFNQGFQPGYRPGYYPNQIDFTHNMQFNIDRERKSKLSYYIEIELELFPGTEINTLQKYSVKCQTTFERIREAWADIFGFQYRPGVQDEAYAYQAAKPLRNETRNETRRDDSRRRDETMNDSRRNNSRNERRRDDSRNERRRDDSRNNSRNERRRRGGTSLKKHSKNRYKGNKTLRIKNIF
jgi:hypothetical protein